MHARWEFLLGYAPREVGVLKIDYISSAFVVFTFYSHGVNRRAPHIMRFQAEFTSVEPVPFTEVSPVLLLYYVHHSDMIW
jgi:hypothetical protein